MPRPGPRRPQLAARASAEDIARIDELVAEANAVRADGAHVNRSDWVRAALVAGMRAPKRVAEHLPPVPAHHT